MDAAHVQEVKAVAVAAAVLRHALPLREQPQLRAGEYHIGSKQHQTENEKHILRGEKARVIENQMQRNQKKNRAFT